MHTIAQSAFASENDKVRERERADGRTILKPSRRHTTRTQRRYGTGRRLHTILLAKQTNWAVITFIVGVPACCFLSFFNR